MKSTVKHTQPTENASPDSPEGETVTDKELPLDQVFEILRNKRRREVLTYLNQHGGRATLSDLAEHVAAIENDTTVQALSSSQRKRVYVGLYQCHFPKMDDMDIVDFDQNRGHVRLSDNAAQVEDYLCDDADERPWHCYYAGTALAGSLLLVASLAGGAAVGLTPTLVLVGLVVSILSLSVVHSGFGIDDLSSLRSKIRSRSTEKPAGN